MEHDTLAKPPSEIEIAKAMACCGAIGSDMIRRLAYQRDVLKSQWIEGYIAGLTAFAWWKDGVRYVGTCGRTLNEEIAKAREEFEVSHA